MFVVFELVVLWCCYLACLRLDCSQGVHRSVAIALWLVRVLRDSGVTTCYFLPSLASSNRWDANLEAAVRFVTQEP